MKKTEQKKLQDQLQDQSISAFNRYRSLALGTESLWYLIKFELIMFFIAPLPGAVGLLLRKYLFPSILGSVGKGVIFGRSITIRHGLKVSIGDNVTIDDYAVLDAKGSANKGISIDHSTIISRSAILSCKGADINIGSDCAIGINSLVHAYEGSNVTIGNHVLCGAFCYFIGSGPYGTKELDVPFKEQGIHSAGGIVIEDNVWFGSGVQVLDGIGIESGSIIGSNAVVNKSVEKYSVSAGVPAKQVKRRVKEA